jgi:hypothetical protein
MLGTIYSLPAKAAATAVESAVPFTGLSGVALGKKQVAIEDCELEHFVTRRVRPKEASSLQEKANPAICGLERLLLVIPYVGPKKLVKAPQIIWRNRK